MRLAVKHFIAFCNKFSKLNNIGPQMVDSNNHMTFKLFCINVLM